MGFDSAEWVFDSAEFGVHYPEKVFSGFFRTELEPFSVTLARHPGGHGLVTWHTGGHRGLPEPKVVAKCRARAYSCLTIWAGVQPPHVPQGSVAKCETIFALGNALASLLLSLSDVKHRAVTIPRNTP